MHGRFALDGEISSRDWGLESEALLIYNCMT